MKDKKPIIISAIVAAVVIVVALVVAVVANNNSGAGGGGVSQSANPIVGKWKYYGAGGTSYNFIYTFNADGTGTYDVAGDVRDFAYTVEDGNLTITYESGPFTSTYEINGDTLNVKDSFGEDTLYERI